MNPALVQRLDQTDRNWCFDVVRVDVAAGEVLVFGRLAMKGTYRTAFGSCRTEGRSLAEAASVAADAAVEGAAAQFGIRSGPVALPDKREQTERLKPDDVPEPIARVTSRQLAAIHAVARRRGLTLPELGAVVRERTGKNAVEHLTRKEASGLLDTWNQTNGS
jgi:hypothetical protein